MRAGRNTPASVLAYIDAVLAENVPPDVVDLARELGYGPRQIRKVKERHGARVVVHLQKIKRGRAEVARIPAKQNGQAHPEQYVADRAGGLPDEPESPSEEWLNERASEGWATFGLVKGEEQAKREARARSERLRQAELALREKGKSPEQYIQAIDAAVEAMRQEAKAA